MKSYTYQIGKGTEDDLETVAFSEEVFAYSETEAVEKAKAITRKRLIHANEDIVRLLDLEREPDLQTVWTHSAKMVRDA